MFAKKRMPRSVGCILLCLLMLMFVVVPWIWQGRNDPTPPPNSLVSSNVIRAPVPPNSGPTNSSSYVQAATERLRVEAGNLIRELHLDEIPPQRSSDAVEVFIAPFVLSSNIFGSFKTAKYSFSAAHEGKLCYLSRWFPGREQADYLEDIRTRATLPISSVNTNSAINSALAWLSAARADVAGLQRDGEPEVYFWPLGSEKFVPLYRVFWFRRGTPHAPGTELARVSFFGPDNTLLTLRIEDQRYNLRESLRIQNETSSNN